MCVGCVGKFTKIFRKRKQKLLLGSPASDAARDNRPAVAGRLIAAAEKSERCSMKQPSSRGWTVSYCYAKKMGVEQ